MPAKRGIRTGSDLNQSWFLHDLTFHYHFSSSGRMGAEKHAGIVTSSCKDLRFDPAALRAGCWGRGPSLRPPPRRHRAAMLPSESLPCPE